jgi:hypothetical protein
LLPVAVCALAAHAVAYRSFWPGDGLHGYFGWYEPLVASLSIAALAVLAVAIASSRLRPCNSLLQRVLGDGRPSRSSSAGMLAVKGLGFLLAQETLERVLAGTAPVLAGTTLLLMVVAVSAFAALIVLAGRSIVRFALKASPLRRRAPVLPRPRSPQIPRRRSPLADGHGLRAPPLVAA